jgi:DNA-directed RNA polymerase specialized sigma24 family protein
MPMSASPEFHNTRWSLVLESRDDDSEIAQRALSELCVIYWHPLYCFIRRSGKAVHDAEDLTQEFLHGFLQRHDFSRADSSKGQLRSYLLGALKNFLANQAARNRAEKRGGGRAPVSIPGITGWDAAEARFERSSVTANPLTPDQHFDRQWALTVMDRALGRLREEYEKRGKGELFKVLELFLTWNSGEDYPSAAARVDLTETAFRVGVHRIRDRFRRALREEIAGTVGSMDNLEKELKDFPRLLE